MSYIAFLSGCIFNKRLKGVLRTGIFFINIRLEQVVTCFYLLNVIVCNYLLNALIILCVWLMHSLYFKPIKMTNDRFWINAIIFPQYHSDAEAASNGASWSRSDEDQELSKQHWRETQPDKVYGPTRPWHTTDTCEHEHNHTGPGPIKWFYAPSSMLEIYAAWVWITALHATPYLQLPVVMAVFRNIEAEQQRADQYCCTGSVAFTARVWRCSHFYQSKKLCHKT